MEREAAWQAQRSPSPELLLEDGGLIRLCSPLMLRLLTFPASSTQHLRYFSQKRFRGKWLADEAERWIVSALSQNRLG